MVHLLSSTVCQHVDLASMATRRDKLEPPLPLERGAQIDIEVLTNMPFRWSKTSQKFRF